MSDGRRAVVACRGGKASRVSAVTLVALLALVASSSTALAADPSSADNSSPGTRPVPTDRPKPHRVKVDRAALDDPRALATEEAVTCATPAPDPVPNGEPIVVSMPPADPFTVGDIPAEVWRDPWVSDPGWRLQFESFGWLEPLAQRAADDHQSESLGTIVGQAVVFHTENPDPGTPHYGWDEGTATRRLDTLRCLYALSHDERLVAEMTAAANVLLGPRYYGPPNFPVHNHGVLANIALIKAGQQLGVSAWRNTAVTRIQAETPLVFSDKGTSWEQASMYQAVNVVLWNAAADAVGPGAVADAIHANTARAAVVYRWMTEPDGNIVQVGDSDKLAGDAQGPGRTGAVFRDDRAGWVMGRWAWTNPATTYYTVRYGPPRRAHGQQDRGGVTWSTLGVRVLVGPGRFTYDTSSPWNVYMRSPESHNVAVPAGLVLKTSASVLMSSYTIAADAHAWRVTDSLYGRSHTRTVVIHNTTRTLRVNDTFGGTSLYRQQWHLDPAWRLRSRNAEGTWLRFTNGLGRTLTITTNGKFSSLVSGLSSPVVGWNFPSPGSKVPNYQLTLRAYAPMTTTFVVT